MHAEAEVLARLELVELALDEDGVGAEIDELPALHQPADDRGDLGMHERLSASHAHDRRSALVGSAHALLHREMLAEDLDGVLNLSAAGAGEIATEERFQHQHQRISLAAREPLLQEVPSYRCHLRRRDCHSAPLVRDDLPPRMRTINGLSMPRITYRLRTPANYAWRS